MTTTLRARWRTNPKKGSPKPTAEQIKKGTAECWDEFPQAKVGISILTFGIHGAVRQKKRNDCIADVRSGRGLVGEYQRLWRIEEPWLSRKADQGGGFARFVGLKTGGDALRSMALGKRPPNKYEDHERKATVIGGMQALAAIEAPAWVVMAPELDALRLKLKNDKSAKKILALVRKGAAAEGAPSPSGLKAAQTYIRKRVVKEKAGGPAWAARGLALSIAAVNAQHVREAVEGTVGSVLGVAGAATTATGIGAPVGVILTGISLGAQGLAGRTKVEKARSVGLAEEFAAGFQQELERYGVRKELREARQRLKAAEAEQEILAREAKIQGMALARVIQVTVWVGAIGGSVALVYYLKRKWQ